MTTQDILKSAKEAKKLLCNISSEQKDDALLKMADALIDHKEEILAANNEDMEYARDVVSEIMLDRLSLTSERIDSMADGIRQVASLPDPVGKVINSFTRPNGLKISKVTSPMGVIAIIYESRPNVTSDAAALAIKAGSACILRGGKEAHKSALAIVDAMKEGLVKAGLPENAIELVDDTTHASADELMRARGYIDLLIPRGGKNLIRHCVDNAIVPVVETGTGICHIYVDKAANQKMALDIVENAKCSRPSVCNAAEVCLVHKDIAQEFLPALKERLVIERTENPVELRLDEKALEIIDGESAGAIDFDTEFLDYIMGVKVVDSLEDAIAHIREHSTGHSDAIITDDKEASSKFLAEVDSAAVYVNASTRFTDGGEFGLGCEMGISTQKLHARGPLGLDELCSFKYIIEGNGQVR
ncbi:MAG: glutamate-5-semialdehyde dehydrogenase [Clostridiales bacterium]|nr:glutamate-5-semialdehyde dehydrogenase [Clostridiales bacterium]